MYKIFLLITIAMISIPQVLVAEQVETLSETDGRVSSIDLADDGRLYYDNGTHFDFGDKFSLKLNIQLQPRFEYTDFDESSVRGDDETGFSMRRARFILSGDIFDSEFSYKLQTDFASDEGGNDLKDAWVQWNFDKQTLLRFGQGQVPFSRQQLASSAKLAFIDRSIASEEFKLGRQLGVLLHGTLGGAHYSLGAYNGESDEEGRNRGPADNNMQGVAMVTANLGDYGSRKHEGDYERTEKLAVTVGAAVAFGQGQEESADFDKTDVNADIGLRYRGWSLESEYLYRDFSPDVGEESSDIGFYVQTGYFIVPQMWDVGLRFASIDFDLGQADQQEFAGVLGYYIIGHNLKLQTGVSVFTEQSVDGEDLTDFIYQLQMSGYF